MGLDAELADIFRRIATLEGRRLEIKTGLEQLEARLAELRREGVEVMAREELLQAQRDAAAVVGAARVRPTPLVPPVEGLLPYPVEQSPASQRWRNELLTRSGDKTYRLTDPDTTMTALSQPTPCPEDERCPDWVSSRAHAHTADGQVVRYEIPREG